MDESTDRSKEQYSVEFYWRPGCPFCMVLERGLKNKGIKLVKHNIWDDQSAAAIVRAAANGNETVPTVKIADVFLVNPSVKQVLRLLRGEETTGDGFFARFKN